MRPDADAPPIMKVWRAHLASLNLCRLFGGGFSKEPPMPRRGATMNERGVSFKNPGDAQKMGMEDAALRPRFRAVQRKGAELSK